MEAYKEKWVNCQNDKCEGPTLCNHSMVFGDNPLFLGGLHMYYDFPTYIWRPSRKSGLTPKTTELRQESYVMQSLKWN